MHLGRSNATIVSPNAPTMCPGRSNATIVSPNEYSNGLGRFNVTIVSPNELRTRNESRALKRYYSKSKCTPDAQTLL